MLSATLANVDRLDVYIGMACLLVGMGLVGLAVAAWRRTFPSVDTLLQIAALFNTKGGVVLVLLIMWVFTISVAVAFGIWAIYKGVDPSHPTVVTLLGMLTGAGAIGGVSGALFKAMTGEDPRPPVVQSTAQETRSTLPPAVTENRTVATAPATPPAIPIPPARRNP